ncbi:hypothetical protein BC834DRAFT_35503 [Gloeopeniophorella convolvens]|nr:hypothetical protein BC834DRAFT_35503 [Gloeopeniophorella convolvens]
MRAVHVQCSTSTRSTPRCHTVGRMDECAQRRHNGCIYAWVRIDGGDALGRARPARARRRDARQRTELQCVKASCLQGFHRTAACSLGEFKCKAEAHVLLFDCIPAAHPEQSNPRTRASCNSEAHLRRHLQGLPSSRAHRTSRSAYRPDALNGPSGAYRVGIGADLRTLTSCSDLLRFDACPPLPPAHNVSNSAPMMPFQTSPASDISSAATSPSSFSSQQRLSAGLSL